MLVVIAGFLIFGLLFIAFFGRKAFWNFVGAVILFGVLAYNFNWFG